jgi:pimeloyl-ACP methyl ester carboxylesterase
MTSVPATRYAKSGNVHIAYQVMGSGPFDLLYVPSFVSHLEHQLDEPRSARWFERLSSFCRLIRFDKRGTGLSDRVSAIPTLEERMDDVRAVMDAVDSKHAALLGSSEGGPMSILFSATYPQRTSRLILYGGMARVAWAVDYPWGVTAEQFEARVKVREENWGQGRSVEIMTPSLASNGEYRTWVSRFERDCATPGAFRALVQMNYEIDVRHVLPTVSVPTLVLHRTGDRASKVEHGRYLGKHIPGAKYIEFPGDDHLPWVGDVDALYDEIQAFLTGARSGPDKPRAPTPNRRLQSTSVILARHAKKQSEDETPLSLVLTTIWCRSTKGQILMRAKCP